MAKRKEDLVVGLDIGTTKICTIVGEVTPDGVDIIGFGSYPSKGIRKGVVVNIDSTVASIKQAVEEAELMAGCEINSVFAGIAGSHVKGFNSHGIVAVKDKEVKDSDIYRVIDAAKAVPIPMDRDIIHVLPQEYIIDDQDGIKDPLGMSGVRLEAKVHIITAAITSTENIVKCANRTGLTVIDIILQPLAAAEAVLTPDEKELGTALIDIGGGTTDIIIYSEGSLRHTSVLGLGGNHVTNDIAVGLRTPTIEAEKIKHKYGCALSTLIHRDDTIEVPSVGGRKPRVVSKQVLCEIIQPRFEEMFTLVQREIMNAGYENLLGSGVVITGGSTIMEGVPELAEKIMDLPVRRGTPQNIGGLSDVVGSPQYSTGVGLVVYGAKYKKLPKYKGREENIYDRVKTRMREWFAQMF